MPPVSTLSSPPRRPTSSTPPGPRPAFFLSALALLLLPAAFAQSSASLSGRVLDPSGAPVASATISLTTLETGARRTATSAADGAFRFTALPLGPQELRAEKPGFRVARRTGITLNIAQEAVVDLHLELGDLSQSVTVAASAPLVNATTSSVAGTVGERDVKDLPLNGRSFDNLLTLNPGVISYALRSANTSTSNGNTFTVSGRRPGDNLFLLNGVEYMGSSQLAVTPGGASQELLGIDAVREFNVLTEAYSAEYGKRPGAQVLVVTQSGTNSLHGSLFEFLRNSALDARNFFDQSRVPPFRRNQFGGALGGPLRRNKLFLFSNYEGFRQALALSSVAVVPDAASRAAAIPYMKPFLSMWPAPNGPELLVNGGPSGTALSYNNPRQSIREDFATLRADQSISPRDSLSASWTLDDGHNTTPQPDPLFGSALNLGNQVASLQQTRILTPNAVNTLTLGFSRAAFNFDPVSFSNFPASLAFVTGGGPGGIVVGGGATTTAGGTITSAGPNNAAFVWNRRNLFTLADAFHLVRGKHNLSAGLWLQRLRDNEDTASRQLGQATFTSLATLEQGIVSTFQVVPNPNELGWRSLFGAWYAEDVWKPLPNLTLSAGLRHEFSTGWNEVSGRAANYLTDANGVLLTAPANGHSVFTRNNARLLFAPRLGLAWDPSRRGRTALRAAFGTHYALIDALSFLLNSLPPANGAASFSNVALSSITPIAPGQNAPPSCGPAIPAPCTTFAPQGIQPNAKTPTVQEWTLTLEHQLTQNTVLRLSYAGSFGYHGLLSIDPNSIPAQLCANPAGCLSGGVSTTHSTVPAGAQYIPVTTRPNPYLSGGFFWYTEGNSSYNALRTDVERRLARGLRFRASYTWSKSLDMNSGLTGAQSNNQAQMILNRNNLRQDWGPSALNAATQASLSATWELPSAKHKLLAGWQLNGIFTALGGFPFTPQIGSNRSGDGDTRNPDRPSLNPSFTGAIVTGNPNQWFNPAAFLLPAPGTYGNLGRGTFTGPGLADLDVSLFKTTPLTARARLQLRAEFFNALNRANLGTPNATVFSGTAVSPSAGLITSTATTSRQIQFGMKIVF